MTNDNDDLRLIAAMCLDIRKVLERYPERIVIALMGENWEEWFSPRTKGVDPAELVWLLAEYETRAPLTKEQFLIGWSEVGYRYTTSRGDDGYWRKPDTIGKYLRQAQAEAKNTPAFRKAVDEAVTVITRRRHRLPRQ